MAKTANDVVTLALEPMNKQDPDGDEFNIALNIYQYGFQEWGRKAFPRRWAWNYDAVDDRYWVHIAGMLAGYLVDYMSVAESTYIKCKNTAGKAEERFREQVSKRPDMVVENNYF